MIVEKQGLRRSLGFSDALALVVGTIIGTGIFLKTGLMSQLLGSPLMVLIAWISAGFLSLAGALTFAELGSLFPRAGGAYTYLRHAYGELPAFLSGWTTFWIASPGSIAAYGVGAATFLGAFFPQWDASLQTSAALGFIIFFTVVNCITVKFGGSVQVLMTALKVLMIAVLIFGVFFLSAGTSANLATPLNWSWQGWGVFGSALIAALWAFDGWNNLPMAAGEVKDAQRNVPKALVVGMLIILLIYGLLNAAYFFSLPFGEVLTANSPAHRAALPVATKAAQTFLGEKALLFLSLAFVLSALGAMNGSILTNARVPFAMARDGLWFRRLGEVHPRTQTPILALATQGVWACVLASSGSFDQLTDYVIFGSWVFYALCGASIFIFRKRQPDAPRSYRVPGYPVIPIIFVFVSVVLLINTVVMNPRETGIGLVIIGLGVPCYYLFFKRPAVSSSQSGSS